MNLTSDWTQNLLSSGGGLLQRGLQSSGELRNGFNVRKDTERLEEISANEDLLLCCSCSCESSIQSRMASCLL